MKRNKLTREKYHHGDLRDALISAGIDIITEKGVHNLSIRYAAKKIGVSHTAPYRHFKNKEALLVAVAIKGFGILSDALDKAISKYPSERRSQIIEAGWAYIKFAVNNSDYYRIMFGDYIKNKPVHPELFRAHDISFKKLLSLINDCRQGKRGGKWEPEITAVAGWSLLHGYSSWIIDNQRDEVIGSDDQIKLILQKFMALVL